MYVDEEKEKAWMLRLEQARNTSDWVSHWADVIREDYLKRKQKSRNEQEK